MILSATAVLTAVWPGILTSISPCPPATNVAAMSFIGKDLSSPRRVLWTGFLYTLGRIVAYAVLAALLVRLNFETACAGEKAGERLARSGLWSAGLLGIFALLTALGAQWVSRVFQKLVQFEKWARRVTGAVFVLVGVRYSLIYIFEVQL